MTIFAGLLKEKKNENILSRKIAEQNILTVKKGNKRKICGVSFIDVQNFQ